MPNTRVAPSAVSTSNTSHAPITSSATSASAATASSTHFCSHPAHSPNERVYGRDDTAFPLEYTLHPSTEPSAMVNVDSMPSGKLRQIEYAVESPTITSLRGNVAAVVGGAAEVEVVEANAVSATTELAVSVVATDTTVVEPAAAVASNTTSALPVSAAGSNTAARLA